MPAYKRILLKLSGEALMGDDAYGINHFSCPTYSASWRGRSARSSASSWTEARSGAISRSVSIMR